MEKQPGRSRAGTLGPEPDFGGVLRISEYIYRTKRRSRREVLAEMLKRQPGYAEAIKNLQESEDRAWNALTPEERAMVRKESRSRMH